jgi:hypothetical protein
MQLHARVIGEVVLIGTGSRGEPQRLLEAAGFLRRKLRSRAIRSSGLIVPRRGMRASDPSSSELEINLHDWQHWRANLRNFDRLLENLQRGSDFRLVLWSRDWLEGVQAAYEVLNRYQRFLPLPAIPTALPSLTGVLRAHEQLHALQDSVERRLAACALDAWRWLLRLRPTAATGLQLAALFRYLPLEATRSALQSLDLTQRDLDQMELLLGRRGSADQAELALLQDAHALSFFCIDSWHHLEQHGPLATQLHVADLLSGMSTTAVCLALMTRQPPVINGMLDLALDVARPPTASAASLAPQL